MSKLVQCKRLGFEAEGFDSPPIPGPLGVRIMNEISQQGFQMWKNHQTMLINEYRLNLAEAEARKFLNTEMEKFLFGDGSAQPEGFVPPESKSE